MLHSKNSLRRSRDELAAIGADLSSRFLLPLPPIIDLHASSPVDRLSSEIRGLAKYSNAVEKEILWIDKILEQSYPEGKPLPISNAPHLLSLWRCLQFAPYPLLAVNASYPRVPLPPVSAVPGKSNKLAVNGGKPVQDVKVHVVAGGAGGRPTWIRIVALTNVRLLFEFLESDSYLNSDYSDSSSSSSASYTKPSIPGANPLHLTTSIHKLAHHLLQAAALQSPRPHVQIQLPRLRPGTDGDERDGRVERTIAEIRTLGIDVVLPSDPPSIPPPLSLANPPIPLRFVPSRQINLDLSILIALSSAILHSPLPPSGNPAGVYKLLIRAYNKDGTPRPPSVPGTELESARASENWRALELQLGHELRAPLVEEIVRVVTEAGQAEKVEFFATNEAKERVAMIVGKLGGPQEMLRATSMFAVDGEADEERRARTSAFWETSRYKKELGPVHLALSSIKIVPDAVSAVNGRDQPHPVTLSQALAALEMPSSPSTSPSPPPVETDADLSSPVASPPFSLVVPIIQSLLSPFPSPSSMKPTPSLTPHTLRALLSGAANNRTTLSANSASLRSLWTLLTNAGVCGGDPALGAYAPSDLEGGQESSLVGRAGDAVAVAWVCEPRSLGESMRIDRDV